MATGFLSNSTALLRFIPTKPSTAPSRSTSSRMDDTTMEAARHQCTKAAMYDAFMFAGEVELLETRLRAAAVVDACHR